MDERSSAERAGLDRLNTLPAGQARAALLACCTAERWAADVGSGRPYASADDLLARSDAAVAALSQADLEQALAGHPRIGDRASGPSHREQAGVYAADQATIQALADGNDAYERRFGHIYLVCATGRSGAELLALLRERLGHDPATEWAAVRAELGKINRIRLLKLLERAPVSAVTTHVLDTARGMPAADVVVWLERVSDTGRTEIARTRTDDDGRASALGPEKLPPGTYHLVFDTAGYLASAHPGGSGRAAFFPEVAITFTVDGEAPHYHVPLLLSPFGYTTYRGS